MTVMSKLEESNEVQHALDDQIRMRDGAMKLMSACSTLNQALETSKNLLTINARILALMSGLQRQKKQHVLEEYNRQRSSVYMDSSADCCTGRIAMSDMRVPLMWKDNVHFTGKTGDQSYYAFALIRCGEQVRDTSLCEITSADTDMYFAETLIFEDLLPDFMMEFEVYYTVITSSEAHPVSKTPRASISIRGSSRRDLHFKAPKFCLAGHVQLCVDDVRGCMISKDLTMGAKGASGVAVLGDMTEFPIHHLELWGQICCEVAAQPQCMLKKSITFQVKAEEDSWYEYHAELYQCKIHCWKDKSVAGKSIADKVIQLNEAMEVSVADTGGGTDILKITLKNETLHTLQFLNDEDAKNWKHALRKEIHNLRMWKAACKGLMYIKEFRRSRISTPSNATFYEQIDIGDEPLMRPEKSLSNGGVEIGRDSFHSDQHPEKNDDVFVTPSSPSLLNVPSDQTVHVPSEQDKVVSSPESSPIINTKEKDVVISLSIPTATTVSSSVDVVTSCTKSHDEIGSNEGIVESSVESVIVTSPNSSVTSVVFDAEISYTTSIEEDDDNEEKIVYQKINSMINDITENENVKQDEETSSEMNGEFSTEEGKHDTLRTNTTNVDVANDSTPLIVDTNGNVDDDACGNVSIDSSIETKTNINENNHVDSLHNCTGITNIRNDPEVTVKDLSENTDVINDTTNTPCSDVGNITNDTENINNNTDTDSITSNENSVRNNSDTTSDNNTNAVRNTTDNITNTDNDSDDTCVVDNNAGDESDNTNAARNTTENITDTDNDNTRVVISDANDVSDDTNVASNHIDIINETDTTRNNTDNTDNKNISANTDDTNGDTGEVSNRIDSNTSINNDTDTVSDNKDTVVTDTIPAKVNTTNPVHDNIDNITVERSTDVIEGNTDNISSSCTDGISENANADTTDEINSISDKTEIVTDNNTDNNNIDTNSNTDSVINEITDGTATIINNTDNVNTDIVNDNITNAVSSNTSVVSDNIAVANSDEKNDITDNNCAPTSNTQGMGDNTVTITNDTLSSSDNVHTIKDNIDIVHTSSDKLGESTNNNTNDDTMIATVAVVRDNSDDIADTSDVISNNSVVASDNSIIVTDKSDIIDNSDVSSDNPDVVDEKVDNIACNTNDSNNHLDVGDNECSTVVNNEVIHGGTDTINNNCSAINTVDPNKRDDSVKSNEKDISSSADENLHKEGEQKIDTIVEKEVER